MIYYNNVVVSLIYAENIVLQYHWKIKWHLIKRMKYIEEKNHENYVRKNINHKNYVSTKKS